MYYQYQNSCNVLHDMVRTSAYDIDTIQLYILYIYTSMIHMILSTERPQFANSNFYLYDGCLPYGKQKNNAEQKKYIYEHKKGVR